MAKANHRVNIVRLGEPRVHTNADSLELFDIEGYQVVTKKGNFLHSAGLRCPADRAIQVHLGGPRRHRRSGAGAASAHYGEAASQRVQRRSAHASLRLPTNDWCDWKV